MDEVIKGKKPAGKHLGIKVSADVLRKIKEVSREKNISVSEVVRQILDNFFEN